MKDLVNHEQETCEFTWKANQGTNKLTGRLAGTLNLNSQAQANGAG